MSGESPGEESTGDPAEFNAHPRWQRILIGLAGPVSNFLLALLLMTGFYMMHNEVEAFRSQAANIDFVSDHTAAATAGLKPGDVITRFDNVTNPTWEQVSIRSAMNVGQTIPVDVKRDGQTVSTQLMIPNPHGSDDFDFDTIGFVPRMQEEPHPRPPDRSRDAGSEGRPEGRRPDSFRRWAGAPLRRCHAGLSAAGQRPAHPVDRAARRPDLPD